ncbi:hypothetical protein ACN2CC_32730 [Mesorhizobium muleiense]|uniref:hypothetical protein n=1 Tax=Mesorhizobium muleiense TaxID=1004279 RepID=UPI003AFA5278
MSEDRKSEPERQKELQAQALARETGITRDQALTLIESIAPFVDRTSTSRAGAPAASGRTVDPPIWSGRGHMGLVFTGEEGISERFELLLEDFDGTERVLVVTSTEAIEDFGLDAVREMASKKYNAGQLDEIGRVRVLTSDLQGSSPPP